MTDSSGTSGPDDTRLEQLDDRIRDARAEAEDVVGGPDEQPGQPFHESGDGPQSEEQDDQTIAPPG